MSISIHGSAAATQSGLEALTPQHLNPADVGAAALLAETPPPERASAAAGEVVQVSGLPAILTHETSALTDQASAVDAAVAAGTTIEGLLARLRQDALSASDPKLSSDSRAALDAGFQADLAGVQGVIAQAGVGGVNLIDGSATHAAGAPAGVDLTLGGPLIGVASNASLSNPGLAGGLAEQLGSAIDNVRRAVGAIAAHGEAIQSHLAVLQQAGSATTAGGRLDSDGARLQALQIQQQLIAGGGSLAGGAPQSILALFR